MKQLTLTAILTVVLTLAAGHVHAQVLPPWPMYAGQSFGSDNWWADPVRREYFWEEAAFSGFIANPAGGIYGLTENSIAQGAVLTNTFPQLYNQYVPNYLYCISDFLGITAGFCVKDFRMSTTAVYAPFDYGAPQRAPNGGDVAVLSVAAATFGGGTMNPSTGLWPNPGQVISGIQNFSVTPYGGIPFKGMTVGVTTYTPVGSDTGAQKNLVGIVDDTATSLRVPFYLGKAYTLAYTWMKGNFFRINGAGITNYDRGAPVYVPTKDNNGNPCASMLGLIEVETRTGKAWAQNYISTVVPAAKAALNVSAIEVAGGNCRWAFSWPVKVGALNMSQTQYNTAATAYTNVNQALTAQSSSGTQWQDVIGDVDPNITSIGYTDNGDPTHPVVQVTYACQPNVNCPGAPDIQRAILNARDSANPTGPTVSAWLSAQHVAGLQVEMLPTQPDANGVMQADDNSYVPAVQGSY